MALQFAPSVLSRLRALKRAVDNVANARRSTMLAERVDDRNFAPAVTRHMAA